MTQTRKTSLLLLFLALVVAGGAGALLLLGSEPPERAVSFQPQAQPVVPLEESAPSERTATLVEVEPADLGDAALGSTVVYPLEVRLSLLQRAAFQHVDGLGAIGSGARARLRGLIRGPRGEGLGATVTFVAGTNAGRTLTCDATGRFGASDLYPGLALVRVETPLRDVAEREVRLRDDQDAVLNVGFGRPSAVYGKVVDRAGDPLPGVRVTMDGQRAETDDLGEFYFPRMTCGDVVLATFEKEGYARYRETLAIAAGTTIPKDRLTFTLDTSATLKVSVNGNIGATGEPAKLFVFPISGQRVNSVRGQRTFPWHLVSPVDIYPGGTQEIDGLPEGLVQLVLFRSGAVADRPFINIKLYPGRVAHEVIDLRPAPQIKGRVMRGDKPVGSARVTLEAPNRLAATHGVLQRPTFHHEELLPQLPSGLQVVHTDAAGRFFFTAFPELNKGYYLTAETTDGLWRGATVVRDPEGEVVVEVERASQLLGSLTLGLSPRFQGLPASVFVMGAPRDPLVVAPEEEALVIDQLEAGTWRVDVEWERELLLENMVVQVGQEREVALSVVLPEGAVDGQSAEERRRAGH